MKTWESKDKRKPNNHTTGIVIQRADNPTDYRTDWIHDYKEKIVSACAHELVRIKDAIRKPNLTLTSDSLTGAQFSRFEEKSGDTILNLKLRELGGGTGCLTEFLSYPSMQSIPVQQMFGKRCNVKCEILIESMFVGATSITIQAKLDRACVSEPKKMTVARKPMHVYIRPDDEVHEVAGVGENEVEIPAGESEVEDEKYFVTLELQKMDDIVLAIETFYDFETKMHEIEGTYAYSSYDNATEEKQHEMENVLQVQTVSLFKEYIDWLIEEYGEAKHRACIRMAYNLILKRDSFTIRRLWGMIYFGESLKRYTKRKLKNDCLIIWKRVMPVGLAHSVIASYIHYIFYQ